MLEVNCLPSLSSSSQFDKHVKTKLVADTLNLIGMKGYDKIVMENIEDSKKKIFEKPNFK